MTPEAIYENAWRTSCYTSFITLEFLLRLVDIPPCRDGTVPGWDILVLAVSLNETSRIFDKKDNQKFAIKHEKPIKS